MKNINKIVSTILHLIRAHIKRMVLKLRQMWGKTQRNNTESIQDDVVEDLWSDQ